MTTLPNSLTRRAVRGRCASIFCWSVCLRVETFTGSRTVGAMSKSSLSCSVDCERREGRVTCDWNHACGRAGAPSVELAGVGEAARHGDDRGRLGAEAAGAQTPEVRPCRPRELELVLAPSALGAGEEGLNFVWCAGRLRRIDIGIEDDLRAGTCNRLRERERRFELRRPRASRLLHRFE